MGGKTINCRWWGITVGPSHFSSPLGLWEHQPKILRLSLRIIALPEFFFSHLAVLSLSFSLFFRSDDSRRLSRSLSLLCFFLLVNMPADIVGPECDRWRQATRSKNRERREREREVDWPPPVSCCDGVFRAERENPLCYPFSFSLGLIIVLCDVIGRRVCPLSWQFYGVYVIYA